MKKQAQVSRPTQFIKKKTPSLTKRIEKEWIDIYLQRASHFSQLGLLLITLLTLYFTVIPLYKTAILEEQISKRELDLQKIKKDSQAQYERLREISMRIFVATSVDCLFVMPPRPEDIGINDKKERVSILSRDVQGCLRERQKNSEDLKILSNSDKIAFDNSMNEVINQIEKLQEKEKARYHGVTPKLAHLYDPPKKGNWLDNLIKMEEERCERLSILKIHCNPEVQIREHKAKYEKLRIEQNFTHEAITHLKTVNNIAWPAQSEPL